MCSEGPRGPPISLIFFFGSGVLSAVATSCFQAVQPIYFMIYINLMYISLCIHAYPVLFYLGSLLFPFMAGSILMGEAGPYRLNSSDVLSPFLLYDRDWTFASLSGDRSRSKFSRCVWSRNCEVNGSLTPSCVSRILSR